MPDKEQPSGALMIGNLVYIAVCLVAALVVANWVKIYSTVQKDPAFIRRNPHATIAFGVMSVLFFALERVLVVGAHQMGTRSSGLKLVGMLLSISLTNALAWVAWYRLYLTFWNVKVSLALLDEQWAVHIDDDYVSNNFYLSWRTYLGSSKAIANYCLVWYGVVSIAQVIIVADTARHGNDSHMAQLLGLCCALAHILLLTVVMPKYDDIFRIRREMMRLVTVMSLSTVVLFVMLLAVDVNPPSWPYLIYNFLFALAIFAMVCVQFPKVFYDWRYPLLLTSPRQLKALRLESAKKWRRLRSTVTTTPRMELMSATDASKVMTRMTAALSSAAENPSAGDRRKQYDTSELALTKVKQLIQDKDGFALFSRHLAREFSTENILFLVECQQLVDFHEAEMLKDGMDIVLDEDLRRILPSNLPMSSIVKENDVREGVSLGSVYVQCIRVFVKYIPNNAPFSINISGRTRQKLAKHFNYNLRRNAFESDGVATTTRMEAIDMWKMASEMLSKSVASRPSLLNCWDQARAEIDRLLRDSLSRFVLTDAYSQWRVHFKRKMSDASSKPKASGFGAEEFDKVDIDLYI